MKAPTLRVAHVELRQPAGFPWHYIVTLSCGHATLFMATPNNATLLMCGRVVSCSFCGQRDL